LSVVYGNSALSWYQRRLLQPVIREAMNLGKITEEYLFADQDRGCALILTNES